MDQLNQVMPISRKESDIIWKAKAVAIVLTVCAHCNTVPENASFAARTVSYFLASLGSLGVPIFLFLSGYLFSYKPLMKCIKMKIKSVIVPWLVCGTLVYIYIYIRKIEQISFSTYFKWIIGSNTYLWYLSISVLLIILGECICYISNRTKIAIQCIGIICMSISLAILLLERIDVLVFHPYFDIFRWQWIFALGMIARQKRLIDFIPSCVSPFVMVIMALFLAALTGRSLSYWSIWWEPISIIVIISAIMLCKYCKCSLYAVDIGKKSFSIYLLHMPIAGITVNILNRFNDAIGVMTILRPVAVLAITFLLIKMVEIIVKNKKIEPFVYLMLGIR